ncbi:hypothetical protein M407DRAFT_120063 [Tulasnella calospora MUT 4182]|uniref:Uncharacterized protein n=1 Tax=Tulasnella calospora MUT 4182 TaxID=1051891 RepID=A0A0C3QB20_9AGAM|nr:hypothetical protein M407DRAFT_120063 [Tulasnella calospora MUT 4182]
MGQVHRLCIDFESLYDDGNACRGVSDRLELRLYPALSALDAYERSSVTRPVGVVTEAELNENPRTSLHPFPTRPRTSLPSLQLSILTRLNCSWV